MVKPVPKRVRNRVVKSQSFMLSLQPSPLLAEIVGSKPLPRTQAVSKVWEYVKKNNLQNPKNNRNIICDEKLLKVLKKREVSMFELAGIIGANLDQVKK